MPCRNRLFYDETEALDLLGMASWDTNILKVDKTMDAKLTHLKQQYLPACPALQIVHPLQITRL